MSKTCMSLAIAASLLGPATAVRAQEDWVNDPRALACTPGILKKGGTVTLRLGPNHGSEMAIRRLGTRISYFLVVRDPPREMKPLMTPEAFRKVRRVALTDKTEGLPWVNNSKSERVFSRPGRYQVYISDVLESEAGGNICTIDYRP